MRFILALILGLACNTAYAGKIKVEVENDAGTEKCDYQLNQENGDRYWEYNFCETAQDARCLTDFNVATHEYNLQEHYGLGGHTEKGLQLYCYRTEEFNKEVIRLAIFDPAEVDF